MSLHKKTIIGIFWSLLRQLGLKGINGIITVILAWFLVPEDFGFIGMLSVFIQIANTLMDSGFKQALIQQKNISNIDLSTAFYTNIILGVISYFILFVSAPVISSFYNEPKLLFLIRIVGVVIIINSFKVVQEAILSKTMNFRSIAVISVSASFLSGIVSVILAKLGFGVWALIIQMLLSSILTTVVLWVSQKWKPGLFYSFLSFKRMFNYGFKLFLAGLINTIFENIYIFAIAKIFSAQEAGYYFFASKLQKVIIAQINLSVQNVTFPALASIKDKKEKLRKGFQQLLQILSYIIFPVALFSAAIAEPLFKFLLSAVWFPAIPFFQILMVVGALIPLHGANLNLLKVRGRSDVFLYLVLAKKIFAAIVLFVSIRFGLYYILLGQVFVSIINYIPDCYFTNKCIDYSGRDQIKDVIPSFSLAAIICIGIYLLIKIVYIPDIFKIIIFGINGFILYFFLSKLFRFKQVKLIKNTLDRYKLKKS